MYRRGMGLPINAYVVIFIVLTVGVLGGVGGLAFQQIDEVRAQMRGQAEQAARTELNANLQQLAGTLTASMRALAEWDEVRQQLVDPTYYTYWRDHRLASAGKLPAQMNARLFLYDPQGVPLDGVSAKLEHRVVAGVWAERVDGVAMLRAVQVVQPQSRDSPLGFAELRTPLLDSLRNGRYPFRYVDPSTLRADYTLGERINIEALGERTAYALRADAADEGLREALMSGFVSGALLVLLLSVLLYGAITAFISLPLRRLSRHIDALAVGTGRARRPRLFVRELSKVWVSLREYQSRLNTLHRRLDDKNRELWELAHRDALTEVFNRRGFEEDVQNIFEGATEGWVAVLLFDCNHFKAINDTYGHAAGDAVLRGIATALGRALRQGDRLYRLGGDEFAAVFSSEVPGGAVQLAQRCLDEVKKEDFSAVGIREPVKLSIGICEEPAPGVRSFSDLMRKADVAMYHAKRPNRSHLAVYLPEMEADSDGLVSHWTRDTVYAVLAGTQPLQMYYQPVMHLETGRVKYYEALVRIERGGELILPRQIMPIIQGQRLEPEFDAVVVSAVCADIRAGRIPDKAGVAVNLSAPTLSDEQAQDAILELTEFLPQRSIMLELTETTLIASIEHAADALERLRRLGFVIVLDDFGSGYSSLRYVADMPVDIVKFDLALVRSLVGGARLGSVVAGLVQLMRATGYELVAEGIESRELAQRARDAGFEWGQGAYLGAPESMLSAEQGADANVNMDSE